MTNLTPKQKWKKIYRRLRVARREANKATMDMMHYGTGIMMIPSNGDDPHRVHPSEVNLHCDSDGKLLTLSYDQDSEPMIDHRKLRAKSLGK